MSIQIPADLDAERGVIANLLNALNHAELTERVNRCEGIGLDHFTGSICRSIWGELNLAVRQSVAVDMQAISTQLSIPISELMDLQNEQPTTALFPSMLKRLGKAYIKQQLALEAQRIVELCKNPDLDPAIALERLDRMRGLAMRKSQAAGMKDSLLSGEELFSLKVKPRECYLGTWLRESSLGWVYGPRGQGKTWFSLGLARAIAEGSAFGSWHASKSRRVVYVDGEMPLDSIQERDNSLRTQTAPIHFLNHEVYFDKTGKALNLTDPDTQRSLTKLLLDIGAEVVVMDNLSCLFNGMAENEADDWEKVLPWLLDLRRHKIAVIIVHHSGRAGTHMRGTSRREDAATWIIRLTEPSTGHDVDGVSFVAAFTKKREGTQDETQPIELTIARGSNGKADITFKRMSPLDELRQWMRDGITNCADLSDAMGISKPSVSKLASKAIQAGWLRKNGRDYELLDPKMAA